MRTTILRALVAFALGGAKNHAEFSADAFV